MLRILLRTFRRFAGNKNTISISIAIFEQISIHLKRNLLGSQRPLLCGKRSNIMNDFKMGFHNNKASVQRFQRFEANCSA